MAGIFNSAFSESESSAVSESEPLYYHNYGSLFIRSFVRLRSFASGKANEVFYVPFERSMRELVTTRTNHPEH